MSSVAFVMADVADPQELAYPNQLEMTPPSKTRNALDGLPWLDRP